MRPAHPSASLAIARRVLAGFGAAGAICLFALGCADIIGIESGRELEEICSCAEFNHAPDLEAECRATADLTTHQSPEFLKQYIAAGPSGVACPDCTHLQECLTRLDLDERYIPCDANAQCAAQKCCLVPGQSQKTCCSTCDPCTQ
jgi:hypothetical protein